MSLAFVLLAGCFAELTTGDEPDTTSSSQTCTPGSVACACYGNATCDAGLECVAEISACVPAGCTPGTLQCTCDGTLCAQDLECNAGLCVEPESGSSSGAADTTGSTSASDDSSTESGPTTSVPSTTDDPSTTMSDPSTSTSSDPGTESESESDPTSESDSGDPACDEMTCSACVQCVAMPEGECAAEAAECDANVGCGSTATCLASCAAKGICFDDCCEDKTPAAIAAALALDMCREDACAGVIACGNYNNGICGG